jgi:hypothetical protein
MKKRYSRYPLFEFTKKHDAESKVKELTKKYPEEIKKGVEFKVQTITRRKSSSFDKEQAYIVYARHEI